MAKDLVFAGFTPYYTAAIWATYDTHAEFPESDREFHKRLWAKVMNEIHEGLADMDFETSATVQEATICTKTGLLARSSCPSITEYFAVSDLPTERCKGHYTGTFFQNILHGIGEEGGSACLVDLRCLVFCVVN